MSRLTVAKRIKLKALHQEQESEGSAWKHERATLSCSFVDKKSYVSIS